MLMCIDVKMNFSIINMQKVTTLLIIELRKQQRLVNFTSSQDQNDEKQQRFIATQKGEGK